MATPAVASGSSTSKAGSSVSDLRSLLHEWGIADVYISNFEDEDWTVRALMTISHEDIVRLIPKPGPRSLFVATLQDWQKKPVNPDHSDSEESDTAQTTLTPRSKKRRLDNGQLALVLNSPDVNAIHIGLKKTLWGTLVLSHYRAHKVLDDYTRNILSGEVIEQQLINDLNKALERKDYCNLANQIVELFPTESKETWYEEVKKKKTTVIQGRLRTKYYTIRKGLINSMLIPTAAQPEPSSNTSEELNFDELGEDKDDEDFNWLLNNDGPWETVEVKWPLTSLRRKKHLHLCEKVDDYIKKFPCLKKPLGWSLLAADGIKAQPNLEISLRESWPEYSKFLLAIIRQKNKTFLKGRKYNSLSTEQQFVAVWLELPKLFQVRTLPKSPDAGKRDRCWRASFAEILEGLCLQVDTIAEIAERIEARKKLVLDHKYQLQPVPVLLGPITDIKQCFIVLDDQRWEVGNPFEAVEGTFRLMFGADAKYPADSRHIWLLIQLTLYKIQTPYDYIGDSGLHSHISGRLKDFELFTATAK